MNDKRAMNVEDKKKNKSTIQSFDAQTNKEIQHHDEESLQNEPLNDLPVKSNGKINRISLAGIVCLVVVLLGSIYDYIGSNNNVRDYQNADQYIESQMSETSEIGMLLFSADEQVEPKDFTIEHTYDGDEYNLIVWDFAAEDGDYVQVYADGVAISEEFMIKHARREFTVPVGSNVQIKGIRDGGGGITYAAYYELDGTTYFNAAPVDDFNTYTLIDIAK